MNFEEFLLKKKIDPVQLQSAEPSLFSEFSFHYNQMGERSFDHSKKFWFNKLRRKYHLEEVPKIPKLTDEPNRIAEQAEPLHSPSIQATGYTPGYKPGITVPSPSIESQSAEKPAYKPRFKAAVQAQDPSNKSEGVSPEDGQAKPVYKPRFKAQLIEPSLEKEKPEVQPEETRPEPDQPKPAYKPRFKPGLIPPKQKEEE